VITTTDPVAATTPYPWPYDGRVDGDRLALVIAGHDAAWATRCADAGSVVALLDRLTARLLDLGVLVVRVRHQVEGSAPAAPPGRLAGDPRVAVATAAGVDGFYGSDLDHRLRDAGCDQLLLAGFGIEGPVHSTMRSANDRGYECLLLHDATASLDPDLTHAAVHIVEMSGGIFGAVGTSTALLAAVDPTHAPAEPTPPEPTPSEPTARLAPAPTSTDPMERTRS
jgi:nicotinamidase-related amidase